jgi:hypothetical protein
MANHFRAGSQAFRDSGGSGGSGGSGRGGANFVKRSRVLALLAGTSVTAVAALYYYFTSSRKSSLPDRERVSVEQRVAQYGARADARLRPAFQRAGVSYPPAAVALLVFKDTRVMEIYARALADDPWRYVTSYPVLGASGKPGPKLAEGDRQVPEGVYQIELLNPVSRFHLSLRLNYPNEFDCRMGAADGRSDLGSDIMIHGGDASIGCLAMGDDVAEDLFILAARTGKENVRVLIAPTDFRIEPPRLIMHEPCWVSTLYATLHEALLAFRRDA